MTKRIVTGAGLGALLLLAIWLGGWVFAVLWIACVCIALYEMFHVISCAGHDIVAWPTWVALLIAIPGFLLLTQVPGLLLLVILVAATLLLVTTLVIFSREPKLEDLLTSLLPLFCVALTGMSLLGMTRITPATTQRVYMSLAFFIPVIGDLAAFFVGIRYGKTKLNPPVSPNKTIEGALAGLAGSVLTACAVYAVGRWAGAPLPRFFHFPLMGLLGGAAGQIGDLFASLVKRHCKVKDYSQIFPGHGGMLDRLDSILFAGTLVFLYQAIPQTIR
ncbi:MAG TPA: phosphatidate cytidylyltransferase [Candidatus Limnocylindria bacterium]|nr:phosphatidate cytidylyltransferase [Candidatus Limnocylindria bacterium]